MQKISTVALSVQKLGWGGLIFTPPPPIPLAYIKKPIPNRVNGFLGKLKIPMLPPLLVNDTFEINFLSKANIFNEHFSN